MNLTIYHLPLKAAIVGIVINVILSYTVSYLPKWDIPIYSDTISMMEHHRRTIVTSSIIVAIAVYLSTFIAKNYWK